ncbi:MAG: TlyA family RNA methyltransferase, partial [Firmicutes bacterium]|nr:TlyA family RNA methyltransferase [Bacillota bacterium]
VFPVAFSLMKDEAEMVCLVKPQFEAGREQVGKNGIVRERKTHLQVLKNVGGYALENGFTIEGVDFSPVKGAKGNIEYLMFLKKPAAGADPSDSEAARTALASLAETIVASSHEMLD